MVNENNNKKRTDLKIIELPKRDYKFYQGSDGNQSDNMEFPQINTLDQIMKNIQRKFEQEYLSDDDVTVYDASKVVANKITNDVASAVAVAFGIYYFANKIGNKK